MTIETTMNAPGGANAEPRALTTVLVALGAESSERSADQADRAARRARSARVSGGRPLYDASGDADAAGRRLCSHRRVVGRWGGGELFHAGDAAVMTGDGTNKPKRFLCNDMIAEGSHDGHKIGFTLSRAAGAFAASNRASLLGYPATKIEDMSDIGANPFAIAFGDFLPGFLIVNRHGARGLRDPHSLNPALCSTGPSTSAAGRKTLTPSRS